MSAKSLKHKTVGLKDLRENMEKYIREVGRGNSVTVFRRSTPLFRLTPVDSEEGGWESVADLTSLDKRGVSAQDILASIRKLDG